jgi:tetratricopeptide (TPR) repeat protein
MKAFLIVLTLAGSAFAQHSAGPDFNLSLPEQAGRLSWSAPGFEVTQSSAKPHGQEIGIRGQDSADQLSFLGFLFLMQNEHDVTSAKCRDEALAQEKKSVPSLSIERSWDLTRQGSLPVSLATYTTKQRDGSAGYHERGFVASGNICGDLEVYTTRPIGESDPVVSKIFVSYRFEPKYSPGFSDVVLYAQILYDTNMFAAAAPYFEKALTMVPADGAPFPSAKTARRVLTDQAGMAYGMSGGLEKSRSIFESAKNADPDYPMYYYNLACADAEEKNLANARIHLQQAFARKANVISGEKMPDPTTDGSFLPYKEQRDFWAFLEQLKGGN